MATDAGRQLTVRVERVNELLPYYVVANTIRVSGYYETRDKAWTIADRLLKRWGCSLPTFGEPVEKRRKMMRRRYVFTWPDSGEIEARSFEATTERKARELLCTALGRKRCPRNMTTKEHPL